MEWIQALLSQSLAFIIPLIILLGALIFVHELGHFLVAKYFGVRVEVFSLGFGKKIFQFKKGDTVYCISAIPFGGYVKMFGDDPSADLEESEKACSFLHKPVGQRIAIVLAGPLMNLFFAFFLFWTISLIGDTKPLAIAGNVQENTDAYKSGIRSGDKIVRVNNKEILTWDELQKSIQGLSGSVNLDVQRFGHSEVITINAPVSTIDNPNILSLKKNVQSIKGLDLIPIASTIGISQKSIAYEQGLRTGDRLISWDGNPISRWYELEYYSSYSTDNPNLVVERLFEGDPKEVSINLNSFASLSDFGIERPDLYVGFISKDSPAEKAGLMKGDKFIKMNGNKLRIWTDLTSKIQSFESSESKKIISTIERNGELLEIDLKPTLMSQENPMTGKSESSIKIGVGPVLTMTPPQTKKVRDLSIKGSVSNAYNDTIQWTGATLVGFVRLFQNEVSTKSIGGPIMIGQVASESFKIGLNAFLKIMAIISINLFIINLLPIPILDGGHLLFYSIEAIRGAPISMAKLEKAQQVGLFVLLFLMIFAMFNDISRVFGF